MTGAGSPELKAVLDFLADGQWQSGLRVLREAERVIPPGQAQRWGQRKSKAPQLMTNEQLITSGRRDRARVTIAGLIGRGRLEADVEKVTRDHWQGVEPFRLRDTMAGYRSVQEAADEIDIESHILRGWVKSGFVPYSESAAGLIRFSPAEFEVCKRVREIWPGVGKIRWPVDPRSVWQEHAVTALVCPHCDGKFTITLGKA